MGKIFKTANKGEPLQYNSRRGTGGCFFPLNPRRHRPSVCTSYIKYLITSELHPLRCIAKSKIALKAEQTKNPDKSGFYSDGIAAHATGKPYPAANL